MKLYYSPGACSLSPHIVAKEAGIALDLAKVDLGKHSIFEENDYYAVNPKGYVPALEIAPGEVLTEGPAIVQYLADLKPASGLVPACGTLERSRVQEMLGYINSEIHKSYSALFSDKTTPEARAGKLEYLARCYALIEKQLAGRDYLFGKDSVEIGSVALTPLGPKGELGILAIGASDAERFHPAMSTEFLSRIGELVTYALMR